MFYRWAALGMVLQIPVASSTLAQAVEPAYRVGVVSESGDIVTWFRPQGPALIRERVVPVGMMPGDPDGPHNLAVAPDQRSYYVTIAHGVPTGSLWRLDAATDSVLGRAPADMYPTTIGLTPDGDFAFVANSDFFGIHPATNPVTVVYTPTMRTLTSIPACDMPHGVRVNHAGTRVYVSCMHDDTILMIDPGTFRVTGHLSLETDSHTPDGGVHAGSCSPTFVSVSADDRTLYVACNASSDVRVVDGETGRVTARIAVGEGAYNVEPTRDEHHLVVTNKKGRSVSLVDLASARETARITTTKGVVHGIAFSPDGRYAYISAESVGADPGSIDTIDLSTGTVVSTVSVPFQPTGIAILRSPEETP